MRAAVTASGAAAPTALTALLESRSAVALDVDDTGRVLVRSDLTGSGQLYEYTPGAGLRALTDFADAVTGRYRPGHRQAVVAIDSGGDERHQLYLLDVDDPPGADRSRLSPVAVDPAWVHTLAGVSPDGARLAYVSNRRNGVDFDVWLVEIDTGHQSCRYDGGGWCHPASGFSPDGRWLSVLRPGGHPLDTDLLLLDVTAPEPLPPRLPLPHPGVAALVGAPAWTGADTFLVATDVGREFAAVVRHDLGEQTTVTLHTAEADLAVWTSRDGGTALVARNDGGASSAALYGVSPWRRRCELSLPAPEPVIAFSHTLPDPVLAPDGSAVTLTVTSPRLPGDVWRFDRSGAGRRLTVSPTAADLDALPVPERHLVPSFDATEVPVLVYRPATGTPGRPAPVVVHVHGGPEAQAQPVFNPVVAGLVAAGFTVLTPNVRGSTGYGRSYAAADDTTRRLDSVADMAALHDWLPSAGLDPRRAALWGGSYGGYMVLAGVAFQPGRWAAGVDIVGISDLVTFLENTSPYRRRHREREYGSLDTDREFLARASPLRRAGDITAPLFVIHGANDPRVPLSEAEQLVAELTGRGVSCELMVFPDEGHGLARLANRLLAYPAAVEFLQATLGVRPSG